MAARLMVSRFARKLSPAAFHPTQPKLAPMEALTSTLPSSRSVAAIGGVSPLHAQATHAAVHPMAPKVHLESSPSSLVDASTSTRPSIQTLAAAGGASSLHTQTAAGQFGRPSIQSLPVTRGPSSLHTQTGAAQFGSSHKGPWTLAVAAALSALAAAGFIYVKPPPPAAPSSVNWEVDWEAQGAVTLPQDQDFMFGCGSCWAHASVGAIEGSYKIVFDTLMHFSVQCVIDCADRKVGSVVVKGKGCRGGNFDDAFAYVQKHGLMLHKDYPQRWLLGHGRCRYNANKIVAVIFDWVICEATTEEELMRAVARRPVAVALDHFPTESEYDGGLIEVDQWPPALTEKEMHVHAALLVGYGTDDQGRKYWKVKNSRGTHWGDRGYAYLRRGVDERYGVGGILRHEYAYPIVSSYSV